MVGIPWKLILNPKLLSTAGDLALSARQWSAGIRTAKDLDALRERVGELAKDYEREAALVQQLTARLWLSFVLGSTALIVGLVSLILVLFR